MFDIDAYFSRIGYAGPRTPTLATLRAIQTLHQSAIPFENLDPLLDRPVKLDLASLQAKLIAGRRGGYCFEHNTLLQAVLHELGFEVRGLAARVLWLAPADAPPRPRTHMLLHVRCEGEAYLADVGFGGRTIHAPIALRSCDAAAAPGDTLRFQRRDDEFVVQARLPDAPAANGESPWRDVYRLGLQRQYPSDFEMANWFTSTHPSSAFRAALIVRRRTPEGELSLNNLQLNRRNGETLERMQIGTPAELAAALESEFGLDPPAAPAALFARVAECAAAAASRESDGAVRRVTPR